MRATVAEANANPMPSIQMEDMDFSEVPDVALKALSEAFASEDSKEARLAFREKRKPNWRNK